MRRVSLHLRWCLYLGAALSWSVACEHDPRLTVRITGDVMAVGAAILHDSIALDTMVVSRYLGSTVVADGPTTLWDGRSFVKGDTVARSGEIGSYANISLPRGWQRIAIAGTNGDTIAFELLVDDSPDVSVDLNRGRMHGYPEFRNIKVVQSLRATERRDSVVSKP